MRLIIEGLFLIMFQNLLKDAAGEPVWGIKILTNNPNILGFLSNVIFDPDRRVNINELANPIVKLTQDSLILDAQCVDRKWAQQAYDECGKPTHAQLELVIRCPDAEDHPELFMQFGEDLVALLNEMFSKKWEVQDDLYLAKLQKIGS